MATNEEKEAGFAESDLISLGQKLASLELTEPERAALAALISDDDVVGFARYNIAGSIRLGFRRAYKPRGKRADGLRADNTDWAGNIDLPKPGRF
jgi:hypothetical protein